MRRAPTLEKCCALDWEARLRLGTPVRNLPCSVVCVRLWILCVDPETSTVLERLRTANAGLGRHFHV